MSDSELDLEALRLIEAARAARTPTAADRQRVRERLVAAGIARSAPVSVASQAPSSASASQQPSRLGVVGWLVGSAAGLWVLLGVCAASAMVGGLVVVSLTSRPEPRVEAAAPAPQARARQRKLEAVAPVAPESSEPETPELEASEAEPATPERSLYRRRRGRRAEPAAADTMVQELRLLHRARTAWQSGEAQRALTLLTRHGARHPDSELRTERDALRILCLCDLDHVSQAKALARRFLSEAPKSPLRATVARSCAFE